jgi:hypothetical protein
MADDNRAAFRAAIREASGRWMDVPFEGAVYRVRTKLTVAAYEAGQKEDVRRLVELLFDIEGGGHTTDHIMGEWGFRDLQQLAEELAGGPGNSPSSAGSPTGGKP